MYGWNDDFDMNEADFYPIEGVVTFLLLPPVLRLWCLHNEQKLEKNSVSSRTRPWNKAYTSYITRLIE